MELRYKIIFLTLVSLLILSMGVSQMSPFTAFATSFIPPPQIDSDRDGLPNTWETTGIDINGDRIIDYNLRAQGANPLHKDIFVEVDFMQFHRPRAQAITNVINSFARAPVLNPDGLMDRQEIEMGKSKPYSCLIPLDKIATWSSWRKADGVTALDGILSFCNGIG